MTLFFQKFGLVLIVVLLSFTFSSVTYGAGCQIKYSWKEIVSVSTVPGGPKLSTVNKKYKTINLNKGQTKTINKNRMRFVKNLKSRNVKFYLKNATDVTLGINKTNPIVGIYIKKVELTKVKCLGDSTTLSLSEDAYIPSPPAFDHLPKDKTKVPAFVPPEVKTMPSQTKVLTKG